MCALEGEDKCFTDIFVYKKVILKAIFFKSNLILQSRYLDQML